jgi:PAS domain S-box-containing protein
MNVDHDNTQEVYGDGRAEEALRRSEEPVTESRLRRLASAGIIGVIRWDLDRSLILEANDEFLRMTGYDRTDLAEGRLNFRHMTPPEWTARNEVGIGQLRETGVGGAYEKEYFRKDGSRVAVIIVGVRFEESASEGMSFVLDITDRKRTEDALRNSESLLRQATDAAEAERRRLADVFQSAPSFMCVLRGPDHVFERANDRYFELLGRQDIIGKPVRTAVPEIEGQGYFEILDCVYRTGQPFLGTDMRITLRRGGRMEERILEFVYQPMRDAAGAVSGILAHGIDLTDHKRAQEELARVTNESERQRRVYETALSNTVDFNYIFDLQGRFLFVNKALLSLWRKELGDALGKTFFELDYPRELAETLHRQIQQVIETKKPFRGETPYTSAFGTRAYEYIFVPVFDARGAVEAVAGSTRDITERKQMEEELRQRAQDLGEADRKKDDFLALLAHELRNPLAPLRNGLQVMRLASGNAKAVEQARLMMDRQLSHMVRLVDDLLDVSRISRNKMELRRSRVALADVVSSAVETAGPLIQAEGHELIVSLPASPIYLQADLTRLAQVFSNLLNNSAKYTRTGGRIWISAERHGEEVTVAVRDTGIGIPAESLENVFNMFSQVDRSIERSTGGLGIGLALVKGLVEMHGGSVKGESAGQDKGSTFTVTLPVLPSPPNTFHANVSEIVEATSGPKRRVLVVDDNRDGAESLAMMLRLIGDDVQTAHDGLEAIEAGGRFLPNIILMDVGLPRLNGLDATRRIRELPWGLEAKIIALTGWGQEGDKERSREAGCDGHLVKPVDFLDLQRILGESKRDQGARE